MYFIGELNNVGGGRIFQVKISFMCFKGDIILQEGDKIFQI